MQWILVFLLTMPCSYILGQDAAPQENAKANAALADAIQQDMVIFAARRRGVPRALRNPPENLPEDMQIQRLLHMRFSFPLDPCVAFFRTLHNLEGLSDNPRRYEEYDRNSFQPVCKKLLQYADARIPLESTESQRAKINAAAMIDIRRAVADVRQSFPRMPDRFMKDIDVFGTGSLFEKVMRQQGFLKN